MDKGTNMQTSSKKAFTMIELVFVIVVIGILSAIAIPKFAATRDDAVITKAIATIASVRSALATERQKRILRGEFEDLNASTIGNNFVNMLEYPVKSCSTSRCNGWSTSGTDYTFHGPTGDVVFELDNNRLIYKSGSTNYE